MIHLFAEDEYAGDEPVLLLIVLLAMARYSKLVRKANGNGMSKPVFRELFG